MLHTDGQRILGSLLLGMLSSAILNVPGSEGIMGDQVELSQDILIREGVEKASAIFASATHTV